MKFCDFDSNLQPNMTNLPQRTQIIEIVLHKNRQHGIESGEIVAGLHQIHNQLANAAIFLHN